MLRFKKYLLKFVFKLHIFRGSGVHVIIYKLIINPYFIGFFTGKSLIRFDLKGQSSFPPVSLKTTVNRKSLRKGVVKWYSQQAKKH